MFSGSPLGIKNRNKNRGNMTSQQSMLGWPFTSGGTLGLYSDAVYDVIVASSGGVIYDSSSIDFLSAVYTTGHRATIGRTDIGGTPANCRASLWPQTLLRSFPRSATEKEIIISCYVGINHEMSFLHKRSSQSPKPCWMFFNNFHFQRVSSMLHGDFIKIDFDKLLTAMHCCNTSTFTKIHEADKKSKRHPLNCYSCWYACNKKSKGSTKYKTSG